MWHGTIRRTWWLLVIALAIPSNLIAQTSTGRFSEQSFKDESGDHKYVVFVPANYRNDRPSPAMMFLHGAGERGHDNRWQLTMGIAPYIQARPQTFPFLVVLPQCDVADGRILESWDADQPGGRLALAALEDARKHFNFDSKKVVLTGWSMGGFGAWSLATSDPSRWSALVPLSGGGDPKAVEKLKDIPVWAFHGAKDMLTKAEQSRKLVDELKQHGGKATYTEFPNGGHDINGDVYGNDAVIAWMLNPQKAPTELAASTVKPIEPVQIPFVPAIDVSHAVGLRLGNEVLDALSYSIPQSVSPDMLRGGLGDMFDSTVAQGRQFNIRFSGISYQAQLDRVVTKAIGGNRLLVQLGIRNITLMIGGTSVQGARHAAQAGPIAIRIAHSYPIPFNLELTPTVVNRRIQLQLVGAGFQIPDNNWSVSQPAGISVQGFGMTEGDVSSGLTQGLYGAKGRIQNEVVSIAPRIIQEIEKALAPIYSNPALSGGSSTFAKLWPLPVYPPRFQIWPEQISVDSKGISVLMGMTLASPNPFASTRPAVQPVQSTVSLAQMPSDEALHVIVSPQVLSPMTDLYVASKQARLDVRDIPEPQFSKLADPAFLREVIPDLSQFGDDLKVRSTLTVLRPLRVQSPEQPVKGADKPLELSLPAVQVVVSVKKSGTSEWKPCATFDLNLSEQVQADFKKAGHRQRVVGLNWLDASQVKGSGKFAEGYDAKDSTLKVEQFIDQFKTAWSSYFSNSKELSAEMPDLDVGLSKLRMSDFKLDSPAIDATYKLARIKLSNLSDQTFTYQTKAPTSGWGEQLVLKPGGTHEFEIPYPLTYRRKSASGEEVYTLTAGSHSEFRVPVNGGPPRLFAAHDN